MSKTVIKGKTNIITKDVQFCNVKDIVDVPSELDDELDWSWSEDEKEPCNEQHIQIKKKIADDINQSGTNINECTNELGIIYANMHNTCKEYKEIIYDKEIEKPDNSTSSFNSDKEKTRKHCDIHCEQNNTSFVNISNCSSDTIISNSNNRVIEQTKVNIDLSLTENNNHNTEQFKYNSKNGININTSNTIFSQDRFINCDTRVDNISKNNKMILHEEKCVADDKITELYQPNDTEKNITENNREKNESVENIEEQTVDEKKETKSSINLKYIKEKQTSMEKDDAPSLIISKLILDQKALLRKYESDAKVGFRGLIRQHPESVREEMYLYVILRTDSDSVIVNKQKKQIKFYLAFLARNKNTKTYISTQPRYIPEYQKLYSDNRDCQGITARRNWHDYRDSCRNVDDFVKQIRDQYYGNYGNKYNRKFNYNNNNFEKYEIMSDDDEGCPKGRTLKRRSNNTKTKQNNRGKHRDDLSNEDYDHYMDNNQLSPCRYQLVNGLPPAIITVPRGHYDRVQCHGCDKRFRYRGTYNAPVHSRLGKTRMAHQPNEHGFDSHDSTENLRIWNEIGDAKQNWKKRYPGQDAGARHVPYPKQPLLKTPKRGSRMPYYRVGDKREIRKCPLKCEPGDNCNLCMVNKYKYN